MNGLILNIRGAARIGRMSAVIICIATGGFDAYGGDVVGKVVAGYQGWLSAPNDGSAVNKWNHTNLECWPDVREYTTLFSGCTFYQAGILQPAFNGTLGNGQPAKLFSNWPDQTVNKHFEWMQRYEIDCAAVQRFGSELGDTTMKVYRDGIASKVQTAAQTYGRKYYIMYDISSWATFQTEIKADWSNNMKLHTNSLAYAKEDGKPVVCVWGIGFTNRPGNATSWADVSTWFKGQGCYVIGGVPGNFYTDTTNRNAYKACNMVMPWHVGKTGNFGTAYQAGLNWCATNGTTYQAPIYPGTSFYNTDPTNFVQNKIKRNHGNFMWTQFAEARNKGVQSIYISMFDEVQEATQIFKTAENASMIPAGKYFLTLDADGVACSSDFYLRLTRDGMRMIKGTTGYVTAHTTSHLDSSPAVTVPSVAGLPQSAAQTSISNAGLVVSTVETAESSTVAAGNVILQAPSGGSWVATGLSVALVVSTGPRVEVVLNPTAWKGGTGFWTNAANWSGGAVPANQSQNLKVQFTGASAAEAVLNTSATVGQLVMGDNGTTVTNRLRLTAGANLTCGLNSTNGTTWTAIGYNRPSVLRVESGAALTTRNYLRVGLDGGTAAVPNPSYLDIFGGTVTVNGGLFLGDGAAGKEDGGGYVTVDNGGQLNVTGALTITRTSIGGSGMNIRNGTVILTGDQTLTVNAYIASGLIAAYGSIGTLSVDYNSRNPGKTTITAGMPALLADGFETGFTNWPVVEAWSRTTSDKYKGSYSAMADGSANNIYGKALNTAGYTSMTVSLWYKDYGIDDADDVSLIFYNGSAWVDVFELGITPVENKWHYKEITLQNSGADAAYFRSGFKLRIRANAMYSGEYLWIDDVKVTVK